MNNLVTIYLSDFHLVFHDTCYNFICIQTVELKCLLKMTEIDFAIEGLIIMNKEYEYFINVHINESKYMRSVQNMTSYFDFSQELLCSIAWQLTKRHLAAHVWTGTLLWGYSFCKEASLSLHTVWPLYTDWVSGVFISCAETWGVQNIENWNKCVRFQGV